jgi:hypothetical protein
MKELVNRIFNNDLMFFRTCRGKLRGKSVMKASDGGFVPSTKRYYHIKIVMKESNLAVIILTFLLF